MPGKTELAIQCPKNLTTDVQIDTKFTGDTGITGTKRLIWSDVLSQSEKIKRGSILQNHQFAISNKTVDTHSQSFQENSSSKNIELYKDLQNNHQLQHGSAIIKNKGTPNLLNLNDNIDGTQTFLTQLSAVKLKSIEKRGKIQTTKMNKFSNLNICSTKREPNPQ